MDNKKCTQDMCYKIHIFRNSQNILDSLIKRKTNNDKNHQAQYYREHGESPRGILIGTRR